MALSLSASFARRPRTCASQSHQMPAIGQHTAYRRGRKQDKSAVCQIPYNLTCILDRSLSVVTHQSLGGKQEVNGTAIHSLECPASVGQRYYYAIHYQCSIDIARHFVALCISGALCLRCAPHIFRNVSHGRNDTETAHEKNGPCSS